MSDPSPATELDQSTTDRQLVCQHNIARGVAGKLVFINLPLVKAFRFAQSQQARFPEVRLNRTPQRS